MTAAATPIAGWASELAVFPEEIALALQEWVVRLEAMIGPMSSSTSFARGTPDGFDGITHRGSYERLLLSEWLLADALPEEFLRRASNAEHSFLRLAQSTPHAARESIVLLDAGPWQLGAPRLAHLALLLTLLRRASKARARFAWGILQAGAGPLFESVDSGSIPSLLAARTLTEPTREMLETWRARLDAAGSARAEVWLVGGRKLDRIASDGPRIGERTQRVIVDEGENTLEVGLGAEPTTRHVTLTLPVATLVTRMLRDPFAGERRARRVDLSNGIAMDQVVVSSCGRKAFARWNRGLATFPIPNSPAAQPGRAKRHGIDGLILAAGLHRGAAMVLLADLPTRCLFLQRVGGERQRVGHFTEEERVHAPWKPDAASPLKKLYLVQPRADLTAFYLDSRDRLFELLPGKGVSHLLARDVLAVTALSNGLAVIARSFLKTWIPNAPEQPALMMLSDTAWREPELLTGELSAARLGSDATPAGPACLSAIQTPSGHWNVHGSGLPYTTELPEHADLVGLRHVHNAQPELILVSGDRRTLCLLGPRGIRTVYTPPSPIGDVSLSDSQGIVTLESASKALHCFSLGRGQLVAVFEARGAS